jgi:hypothetical protein
LKGSVPRGRAGISWPPWHGRCFRADEGAPMTDLVFILVTLAFFALAAAYVLGCERL